MNVDSKITPFRLNNSEESEVIQRSRGLQKVEDNHQATFGDMIANAIDSVDEASKTADHMVGDIVAGKSENIHDTMIAMQKAKLSFQMMVEIRNKALETYQELSRMQI